MFPRLTVDLARIQTNTERMLSACIGRGVQVIGVTKGVGADVRIARALVKGGVQSLGDARLDNLGELSKASLGVPLWLLRSPAPRDVPECVALADGSLQSDIRVVRLVAQEAARQGRTHRVQIMVDLETGREGAAPGAVVEMCGEAARLEGLELEGIGVYFDFKSTLAELSIALDEFSRLGARLGCPTVSGGASNVLELLMNDACPREVNQLRMGTAPLLGIFTSHGPRPIEGWDRDTFHLEAEVIEVKKDRAEALLALGHLDAPMEFLYPRDPGIELERCSSDLLIVRFSEPVQVGEIVSFRLGYNALSRLFASRYTRLRYAANES